MRLVFHPGPTHGIERCPVSELGQIHAPVEELHHEGVVKAARVGSAAIRLLRRSRLLPPPALRTRTLGGRTPRAGRAKKWQINCRRLRLLFVSSLDNLLQGRIQSVRQIWEPVQQICRRVGRLLVSCLGRQGLIEHSGEAVSRLARKLLICNETIKDDRGDAFPTFFDLFFAVRTLAQHFERAQHLARKNLMHTNRNDETERLLALKQKDKTILYYPNEQMSTTQCLWFFVPFHSNLGRRADQGR